jgi:hypothetical protein
VNRPWRSSTITTGSSCAATFSSSSAQRFASANQALAVERGEDLLAVGLIGQRQDRVRVRMVDEASRKEGVQKRLDAGVRGGGVEQVRAKLVDHRLVRHRVERAQLAQRLELHRRVTVGLDRRQVAPRALDVEHRDLLAEGGPHRGLDRRVAAAMQDERRVAPDEARRVRAKGQELRDARSEVLHHLRCGLDVVAVIHGAPR